MSWFRAISSVSAAALLASCAAESGDLTCAPGTYAEGGACLPGTSFLCGNGTRLSGTQCVADAVTTCGPGTWSDGSTCWPSNAGTSMTCGSGTHLAGSVCLPDDPSLVTCGPGTRVEGTTCVAITTSMTCGSGTHLEGLQCLPDPTVTCGAGTHADAGRCVPDATTFFELRVGSTTIPADGYSKIPVLVLGRNADGTPSGAEVVLWVSVPGSGSFSPARVTLGPMGALAYFTPCSSAGAGCTGTIELRVSLASDPATAVAALPVDLVAPTGVGSAAPCLIGGNALFFDGSGWVFTGTQLVTQGTFSASAASTQVALWITPSDPAQGLWWDLTFSSRELGIPLAAQVYDGAQRAPFASPGHPGIDIGGDGRGCNTISGRFEIEELTWSGSTLSAFTATFEQYCETAPSNVLRGCVHFQQ